MQCDMGAVYKPPQCSDVASGHPEPHREARHNHCLAPSQVTDMLASDELYVWLGLERGGRGCLLLSTGEMPILRAHIFPRLRMSLLLSC